MAAGTIEAAPAPFAVRRVVVALDAQGDHGAVIAAACELAGRWHCRVAGVFVIGADLVHLGGLPEVRQVCLSSGARQPLPAQDLEAELAALERRARRALETAARRIGAETSFTVVRGSLSCEAVGLEGEDLLIVEGAMRPFGGPTFETRWRRLAEDARQPVLLRRRRTAVPGPVACFHDGTTAGDRALAAAARISADRQQALAVVLAPGLPPEAEPRLAAWLAGHGPPVRLLRAGPGGDPGWARAAGRPGLLVVPAGMPAGGWTSVPDADVLLVR